MKKNKKLQYVLIFMVLLIWGTIAFRIMNYRGDTAVYYQATTTNPPPVWATPEEPIDSFFIIANYRDPFSGKRMKGTREGRSRDESTRAITAKTKTSQQDKDLSAMPMPSLTYRGYILKNGQIASVRLDINGQAFSMKIKEEKQKVVLEETEMEFIVVSHYGIRDTVYRQKF